MKRLSSAGISPQIGTSLNLLNNANLEQIHAATLEVLEFKGVFVEGKAARDLYRAGGANVNDDTSIVKIPPYMVEEALRTAPRSVLFAGRDPKNDRLIGEKRVAFTSFGTAVYVLDPYTKKHRTATKKDIEQLATLTDALDEIDICFETALPLDVPAASGIWHAFEAHANNTTKNIDSEAPEGWITEVVLEMGFAISGGKEKFRERPLCHLGGCPISPLTLSKGYTDSLILAAKAGAPFLIVSCALSGATAPITIAGTVVIHNAEVLSSVVLGQLAKKGAPMVYGSSTTAMDPRKAAAAVGTPELAMISASLAKIANHYGLPSMMAGG